MANGESLPDCYYTMEGFEVALRQIRRLHRDSCGACTHFEEFWAELGLHCD